MERLEPSENCLKHAVAIAPQNSRSYRNRTSQTGFGYGFRDCGVVTCWSKEAKKLRVKLL